MHRIFLFLRLIALSSLLWAAPLRAIDEEDDGVYATATLLSEYDTIQAGQEFDLAIRMEMDPHWHVYWLNPGDTGLAPTIEWEAPEGFEMGGFRFPAPELITTPPFVSYAYEDELMLLARVKAPETLNPGERISIKGEASWLICSDVCIPGSSNVALDLVVAAEDESPTLSADADKLASAREALPVNADQGSLAFEVLDESVTIALTWNGFDGADLSNAYFFVEQEGIVNSAVAQTISLSGSELLVSAAKSEYQEGELSSLRGILYNEAGFPSAGGKKALLFDSESDGVSAMAVLPSGSLAGGGYAIPDITFAQALGFAFLGGLILNLMPCVFPVLSIKILGFAQQAGEDKGKVFKHGLVFALGVLLSFWALAGALIALRAGGEQLGWGFQLQSPYFVGALLVVMFVFGLSLAGVFEFGTSAISLAGKVKGNGFGGSFFSGVLATVVATPCTGPFMGPALGFALTLSAFQSLTVFTFLGLGMAAPYVTLSSFPKLIEKMPRPGAWMETFKQSMSFPMFATCIWLVWLMMAHVGEDGVMTVLGGLLLIAVGAWVYGRWAAPHRKAITRKAGIVIGAAIALGGIWVMMPSRSAEALSTEAGPETDKYGIVWEAYSPELLESLRAQGKPVYVDFTAKWCLTCKANKLAVFSSDEVKRRLSEMGFAMVRGDWTKRNPEITEALQSFGRSGVPLNVIYNGGMDSEPVLLPELLTAGLVLEELDKLEPVSESSL